MIENRVRRNFEAGRPVINCWLSLGNAFAAEILAEQGFDSLTVDMQHGLNDIRDTIAAFQALRAGGATLLARVPWLEPGIIMKTLDVGALGVICPMISNREQAERFVSYMRYPPDGVRSFGPTRALISAGADYASNANREVMSLAMVETLEGYEKIEEIVSTPGLDGIYIGPADLTIGMTNGRLPPGLDREEDEMIAAIRHILDASTRAGILAGLHCGSPEYAARAIEWGFGLVTISTDTRMLAAVGRENVLRTRELIPGSESSIPSAPTETY